MPQVIYEMSRKKLGMTTVLDDGHLLGMISDGDLRRLLERDGSHALEHTAGEIMNPHPLTIDGGAFASSALALMEEKKITSLIVVAPGGQVEGVVHLHDLWTWNSVSRGKGEKLTCGCYRHPERNRSLRCKVNIRGVRGCSIV